MHFGYTWCKQKGPALSECNESKGFAPIIILIFIAVVVGGYFLYTNSQKSAPVSIPAPQQTIQPTVISSAEISKVGWGFEVKLPRDWKFCLDKEENSFITGNIVSANQNCQPVSNESYMQVIVRKNTQEVSLYSPPGPDKAYEATGKQTVTLGTNKFIKQAFKQIKSFNWNDQGEISPVGSVLLNYDIVDVNRNRVINFYKNPNSKIEEKTIEEILSTFKFTN